MSKYDELQRLAEASRVANHDERGPDEAFHEALHPEVVLSLIAENERLLKILERTVEQYVPLAELDGVPGWSRVVKLNEVCAERNQLRAEIAGLRTGYQAYERVKAELKDEVEALREEVALDDKIIAERNRLLNMFECPDHGQCVPYAMEQVESLRKDADRYRFVSQLAWYVDKAAWVYDIGKARSPWADDREAVDADDVEAAIDAAMGKGDQP